MLWSSGCNSRSATGTTANMAQGISEQEFTQLQNQFLELKATNYALEDRNRKQEAALSELQARLQRSAGEVTWLQQVVDKSKKAREIEALMQTNANMEKKLLSQEDDFRLQNQTLLQELSAYVSSNEKLEQELKALQQGRPELLETQYAEEALRLRAECDALREELSSCRRQTAAQLTELRDKVTALTQVNTQLERAARPEDTNPVATEDAEFVEVGTGEVCYKKAAGGAHELLEAAEHKIQELQNDILQYADMRLSLDTTRRELELARGELRRLREAGGGAGGSGAGAGVGLAELEQLRQKLTRKHDSYLSLQREMETIRQTKQTEIDVLKEQLQKETEEAKSKMQRYQTQLNNGYTVLKTEREKAALTIQGLTERLAKYEPVDSPSEGGSGGVAAGSDGPSTAADPSEAARLSTQVSELTGQLGEARRTAETVATQLRDAETRLNETETARRETATRLENTAADLAETQRHLAETEERRTETETLLEETETRRVETETERDDALKLAQKRKSVLDEMATHIQQLTTEHTEALRAAGEARQQAQALADRTADQLQEAQQKLSRAEAELSRAQESLESERRLRQEQEQRAAEREQEQAARLQQEQQERDQERQERRQELESLEQTHTETVKDLTTQLEISSAQLAEFKEKVTALRQEVKDSVDEKRIHERKGAAVTKDLRRQLAQERRRADRLQQALQDASFSDKPNELSPPPPAESDAQSVSSWSLMSGENGAAPSSVNGGGDSPVDTETVSLLARITRLQEEKWRVEEKLNHLEQSSGALADDLANKSALIQFYCMEGRQPAGAAHTPDGRQRIGGADGLTPVKKLVDFVKHLSLDEQQREMQRRMQRMLEETLTKNMHLQKDLQTMSRELEMTRRQTAKS